MYSSDFICTYKLHDKDDQIHIYRIQLLQAFNMTDYDEKKLETNINTLYTEVKENQFVCELLDVLLECSKYKMFSDVVNNDKLAIFKILFSYDFFDLTHRCLCDLFNKKNIIDINKELLINEVKQ